MMLSLFGPETFLQASDTSHTIYLMINMTRLANGEISIQDIEQKLNDIYFGEFTIGPD